MNEKNRISDNEVDLFEILEIFWNGKWKIISFVVVSLISVYITIKQFQSPPTFTATSEIRPITRMESEIYQLSNAIGFFEVTKPILLNLFIEKLEEKKIFEQIMQEYSVIDFEEYDDEQIYKQDIIELASKIKIIRPELLENEIDDLTNLYWTIKFDYTDIKIWKKILTKVNNSINLLIEKELRQNFSSKISISKITKKYASQDIQIQIDNALQDYETTAFNRLEFLKEQASIARKLEIPKNTLKVQSYNEVITNLDITNNPFYLNGYESIEMEIDLIESRSNKKAFVDGLLTLEQAKRALIQDKNIERAEQAFKAAFDNTNFSAASIIPDSTVIEWHKNSTIFLLAITALLSGLISGIYIFISNILQKKQK